MRGLMLAVVVVLAMAPAAQAAVPGNPDSRPSLTLMAGFGGLEYKNLGGGDLNSRGWSALLALPMARSLTLLGGYSHQNQDLPEVVFDGSSQASSWALRGGLRIYF